MNSRWIALCLLSCLFLMSTSAASFDDFPTFRQSRKKNTHVSVSAVVDPYELRPGQDLRLKVVVQLEKAWHIYAMNAHPEDTVLSTRIEIGEAYLSPQGEWSESEPSIIFDGALDKVVATHQSLAEFSRTFTVTKVPGAGRHPINGALIFRACDNLVCTLERRLSFQTDFQIIP